MPLAGPLSFRFVSGHLTRDLTASLKPAGNPGKDAWTASCCLSRPVVHPFVMEPVPRRKPADDCFVQRVSKVRPAAPGDEGGRDRPLGLRTETVPLTRHIGHQAGIVSQGQAPVSGRPAPGADAEAGCFSRDGGDALPGDCLGTQVVRTGPDGVFTAAMPFAGRQSFAAPGTAERGLPHKGADKDGYPGAVLRTRVLLPVMNR